MNLREQHLKIKEDELNQGPLEGSDISGVRISSSAATELIRQAMAEPNERLQYRTIPRIALLEEIRTKRTQKGALCWSTAVSETF